MKVPLAAGRQDEQHTAAGVARVDLQLRDLDAYLKGLAALAQPAKSRQGVFHCQVRRDCVDTTAKWDCVDTTAKWDCVDTTAKWECVDTTVKWDYVDTTAK